MYLIVDIGVLDDMTYHILMMFMYRYETIITRLIIYLE